MHKDYSSDQTKIKCERMCQARFIKSIEPEEIISFIFNDLILRCLIHIR